MTVQPIDNPRGRGRADAHQPCASGAQDTAAAMRRPTSSRPAPLRAVPPIDQTFSDTQVGLVGGATISPEGQDLPGAQLHCALGG